MIFHATPKIFPNIGVARKNLKKKNLRIHLNQKNRKCECTYKNNSSSREGL